MPLYEYKCPKCGEKFEINASIFHLKSTVKCPKCGRMNPDRVFSAVNTTKSGNSPYSSGSFG